MKSPLVEDQGADRPANSTPPPAGLFVVSDNVHPNSEEGPSKNNTGPKNTDTAPPKYDDEFPKKNNTGLKNTDTAPPKYDDEFPKKNNTGPKNTDTAPPKYDDEFPKKNYSGPKNTDTPPKYDDDFPKNYYGPLNDEGNHDTTPIYGEQRPNQNNLISLPEVIVNVDQTVETTENMLYTLKSIRLAFIRKVYGILLVQCLVTGLIMYGFHQTPSIALYARKNFWKVFGPPLAVYFYTFMCILCCEGPRRKVPYNYVFLLLFTCSTATIMGICTSLFQIKELIMAAGITFVLVLALTLFAFQTKIDFTIFSACGLCILLALTLLGSAMLFTSYPKLKLLYTTIGVIFLSIYIVIDTQMMIGGDHSISFSPEEYVFAALILYVDIVNMFLRILRYLR